MPIYVYRCISCSNEQEEIHPITNYDRHISNCIFCGSQAKKVPARVKMRIGTVVRQLDEKQKEIDNTIIWEPGMKEEARKNREYRKQKELKNIRKVAEDTVREFNV